MQFVRMKFIICGWVEQFVTQYESQTQEDKLITLFPSSVFRIKFDLITSQERPLLHLGCRRSAALDG